jgi:hypothetical protein
MIQALHILASKGAVIDEVVSSQLSVAPTLAAHAISCLASSPWLEIVIP